MKHLQTYNEKFTHPEMDIDGDGAIEIDLDIEDVKIKEKVLYEFLEVHFKVYYNTNTQKYYSLIQYPDINNEGTEQYVGWVVYGDSMSDMAHKLRFQIKMYVKQFGSNQK